MTDPGADAYACERRAHWDKVAKQKREWTGWGGYYHRRLTEIFHGHVPLGQRVLEIGCGAGDLLAALEPSVGVGVDLSSEMIALARDRHPALTFIQADAHSLDLNDTFDVIVLSDVVNDLWDVQRTFETIKARCHRGTRIVLNFYNRLWEQPLLLAQRLGLATPTLPQNWLTVDDAANLLHLADFEVLSHKVEILWPFATPGLASFMNRFVVRFWPASMFALTHLVIARIDLVLDARLLPFAPASLRAIVMTNVFHHVPDVSAFLRAAAQCVRPGGAIVMIEPWVTTWSSFVYRRLHHEPFRPEATEWTFDGTGPLTSANGALPWIVFERDRTHFEHTFPAWRIKSIRTGMAFRYLLSGGMSLRALAPAWSFGVWKQSERWLDRRCDVGMFARIVLVNERHDARASEGNI